MKPLFRLRGYSLAGLRGLTVCLLLATALAGCSGKSQAPVIDKSPGRVIPAEWTVREGDSLYAIAWATGLDYREIAAWNDLKNPDMIRSGQTLRLRPLPKGKAPPHPVSSATAGQTSKTGAAAPTKSAPASSVAKTTAAPLLPDKVAGWNWPAEGEIIARYKPKRGVNGIEIGGKPGAAVRAAAGGDVVYAGEGLRGYGRLIILKHSAHFLSAYAHNREIIVKEGERVKPGQTIARMGSSGTDRTKLHFEIRKNGDTVDPQRYLPKRG